jgi:integrase
VGVGDKGEEYGADPVAAFRPKDIDVILARKLEKRKIGKHTIGGTHAALRLREQLHLLFKFAVKLEWIRSNPVELAEEVVHKGEGFFPWEEVHIAQFRDCWVLGTKPRLALELVLWTGARRGDARLLPPPKNGRIKGRAGKTGKEFDFAVAPMLARAIEAMPAVGMVTLLVTEYGKPFSAAGFGHWFKEKCVEAGLPRCTLHGLRKALARRAADQGVGQQGLKALGQWSGDREVATYVAGADRRRLAGHALDAVIQWEHEANIG